jgi:hypothetical protein
MPFQGGGRGGGEVEGLRVRDEKKAHRLDRGPAFVIKLTFKPGHMGWPQNGK